MEEIFFAYLAVYFFGIVYKYIEILQIKILRICIFILTALLLLRVLLRNRIFRRFLILFSINLGIKTLIDFKLTPFLMKDYDYLKCFLYTNIIYLMIGIISLLIYDYYKIDICGLESLKKAQENKEAIEDESWLIKFILQRDKKNKFFLGLLLSFKNPSLPVIYFREGFNLFNGFTKIKIGISFVLYIIIINIYWNTMVYLGISLWDIIKILI